MRSSAWGLRPLLLGHREMALRLEPWLGVGHQIQYVCPPLEHTTSGQPWSKLAEFGHPRGGLSWGDGPAVERRKRSGGGPVEVEERAVTERRRETDLPPFRPLARPSARSPCRPTCRPTGRPTSRPPNQPPAHPPGRRPPERLTFRPRARPTARPPTDRLMDPTARPTARPHARPLECPTVRPPPGPTPRHAGEGGASSPIAPGREASERQATHLRTRTATWTMEGESPADQPGTWRRGPGEVADRAWARGRQAGPPPDVECHQDDGGATPKPARPSVTSRERGRRASGKRHLRVGKAT